MTMPPDEADEPPPERPYLAAGNDDGDNDGAVPDGAGVSSLRPYLLTSGRVEPVDQTLEIEAQVVTSDLGASSYGQLAFEHRDIVALCATSMSIAEVAARLRLHIGVARVLVADLAASGFLYVRRPSLPLTQDPNLIERVIRGLEAIR